AYARAYELGRDEGRGADFLLDTLAQRLMVMCRWFASVARQPTVDEMAALVRAGHELVERAGDERTRARFQIALGFMPFWLRNAGVRLPTQQDLDDAAASVAAGLATAEELDDPALISAALDAMTSTEQTMDPGRAREGSRRRVAMGHRLPLDERLDALNMVAWTSALLGDLPDVITASNAAMALVQPGQNPGFAIGAASWHAYAVALAGRWDQLVAMVEHLRRTWLDAEQPAASYGLQGFLSGIDWARNRGEDELLQRWSEVASQIVARFDPAHPVAGLAALVRLEMDGIVDIIGHPDRRPDRAHYIEHAIALCADRAQAVPTASIDAIIRRAQGSGMRLLEAQARRLRGVLRRDSDDLARSLAAFTEAGATRYAARLRTEFGMARGDDALLRTGIRELEAMGELEQLARISARVG
ncbi:MAG TPA: hypothetical protein VIV06_00425, partial [Candidatus Limnocylindrales bacterium]